jgi:hypothetical protein
MSHTSLSLKPVNDLLTERFFVPSYQRGFRWRKQQVVDLLNDIWEFQLTCERREEFYCLQPVVVKQMSSGEWELIDGQQRLTTILLILACRRDLVKALRKPTFTLHYATRPKSAEFLKGIDLRQWDANIDYFHICEAYKAIDAWFSQGDGSRDLQLLQCLTNDDQAGKNVKVIWYELPASADPVDAFTRLNVGKIPLTNSELIRALFLRSRNFYHESRHIFQVKIAQEWDAIEKALQSNDMWYFLTTGAAYPASRIEFLFDQLSRGHGQSSPVDPFTTFYFYNKRFSTPSVSAEQEWLNVKQLFMTLEEWFNDRPLFHLIGYLIHDNYRLADLRKAAHGATKTAFRRSLRQTVFERLTGAAPPSGATPADYRDAVKEFVAALDYDVNRKEIRLLLLLFNIASILLNPDAKLRFSFYLFKREQWDIEHIHSVASDRPDTPTKCQTWLRDFVTHLGDVRETKKLRQRAKALLKSDEKAFDMDEFAKLYGDILAAFQDSEDEEADDAGNVAADEDDVVGAAEADNDVGNLTLLDYSTNRSYKNAVFPVKRSQIIALDQKGTFVPLCTKNVFLKYYSHGIGKMMFWGKKDRDAYRNKIIDTLSQFFFEDIAE